MKLLLGFCTTILATSHVLSFAATTKISSPIARAVRTRATVSTCTELKMSGSSSLVLSIPRAGGQLSNILTTATASPSTLFDFTLLALAASAFGLKIIGTGSKSNSLQKEEKPVEVKSLQIKFLAAFWLLRCGYWMSGPYVVPAYKSKVFGGVEASMALVSKIFLSGFAATAIFGPSIGQATDRYGRKVGTIAFALLYSIGIASIKSNALFVLFAGRIVVGCALSLLFTAPEAWVSGEAGRQNLQKYLGETFGIAFTGDALVAIIAGKLASLAASVRGITGPFELGIMFLLAGATVSMLFWNENKADTSSTKNGNANKSGIREAFDVIRGDQKLMLVGAVQSLFEAAMNVFILQWPPIIAGAIKAVFGDGAITPFGTIFSCFMTCSLLGSLTFGKIIKKKNALTESTAFSMLMVSAFSMGLGAYFTAGATTSLTGIVIALFLYELTVGMYFPIIGTLRSKYVPDNNKSVILSLFGIPLNLLVLLAYLFIERLGMSGALGVSSAALAIAAGCMAKLKSIAKAESDQEGYNS